MRQALRDISPPYNGRNNSTLDWSGRQSYKRTRYEEIFEIVEAGGPFCNLQHVASPTSRVHRRFLEAIGWPDEDPSNKLLELEIQLRSLREIGFRDVDCYWKWRELALFAGWKPA